MQGCKVWLGSCTIVNVFNFSEMLNEEYILLADLVISRMTLGQSMSIHIMLRSILDKQHDNYDSEIFKKMCDIIRSSDSGFGEIRKFLLEEGYIEEADNRIPKYRLAPKGKIAKDKGGHNAYKIWESEQPIKKDSSSINIAGNVTGSIIGNESSFDHPVINPPTAITGNASDKKSWLQIIYWIVGISLALTAIWEFVTKHFF